MQDFHNQVDREDPERVSDETERIAVPTMGMGSCPSLASVTIPETGVSLNEVTSPLGIVAGYSTVPEARRAANAEAVAPP